MRRHQPAERNLCLRRQRVAVSIYPGPGHSPGRWRKHHPLDCGQPRCDQCHAIKFLGRLAVRLRRDDFSFREALDEARTTL